MRCQLRLPLLFALVLQFSVGAKAERDFSVTMTFEKHGPDVMAEGVIEPPTPAALEQFLNSNGVKPGATIYFSSPGGNVDAAMAIGRIIRAHRLNTDIATSTPFPSSNGLPTSWAWTTPKGMNPWSGPYPAPCISACTLAFLGGVERSIHPPSFYAVHQFHSPCQPVDTSLLPEIGARLPPCPSFAEGQATTQQTEAKIVAYFQQMGVNPNILTKWALSPPKSIYALDTQELFDYNVIFHPYEAVWKINITPSGEPFLQFKEATNWKTNELRFFCEKKPVARIDVLVVYDPNGPDGKEDISNLLKVGASNQIRVDWNSHPIDMLHIDPDGSSRFAPNDVAKAPYDLGDGRVATLLHLSKVLANSLSGSYSLNFYIGWEMGVGNSSPDQNLLRQFFSSCDATH